MKAKDCSLLSKILAVIVLIAGHVLMWLGVLKNANSMQICGCAFSIMGVFGTVDINLLIDKFTGRGGA